MFIIVNTYGVPQFYGYDEGYEDGDVSPYYYLVDEYVYPSEFDTYEEARLAIYFAEYEDCGYMIQEVDK